MANSFSILKETYKYIEVLLRLDGSSTASTLLLDADSLDFYDSLTPNSSDIQLLFCSANFNLSGQDSQPSKSGGMVKFTREHQTTDAHIITLTGNGSINFSPSLPIDTPDGQSELNFNGDINYEVGQHTIGHVTVVFEKKGGYLMAHNKWRKPGQPNPYK